MTINSWFRSLPIAAAMLSSIAIAAPDTVYVNGKVLTVDDQFSVVQGFALEGDRFVATGSNKEMRALADGDTKVINLKGRTVMPGLIDNHNHFIRGAEHWKHMLRLDGVSSRKEALQLIKSHAETVPEGQWLVTLGGWDEEQFTDSKGGLTRTELDDAAGKTPVFLQAKYDHAFVNTAFMELIGIPIVIKAGGDENSGAEFDLASALAYEGSDGKKPSGLAAAMADLVERDESGTATGLLTGGLRMVFTAMKAMPKVSMDDAIEGARRAQEYVNSIGLTTVYDPAGGLITEQAYAAVAALHADKELTVRVFRTWQNIVSNSESIPQALADIEALPAMLAGDDYYDTVSIGEAHYAPVMMMDGLDEDRIPSAEEWAVALSPLEAAVKNGKALQIHSVRAELLGMYVTAFEEWAQKYTIYPSQITFTHAEMVNPELLKRMQALGISLQLRSVQVVRKRDDVIEQYGDAVVEVPPLRMVQDSGVDWGLGSDGTKAAQINPMISLGWAVTGKGINGDQLLEKQHLLTREEALMAHTRGNTKMLFRSNRLGQIRPGFLADFIVLDADYMKVNADKIMDIKVLETVVGGKQVYKR